MTAPFLPRISSGSGWGGPVHDLREKTIVFLRESHTMQPMGFSRHAATPAWLYTGVFSSGPPNRKWENP